MIVTKFHEIGSQLTEKSAKLGGVSVLYRAYAQNREPRFLPFKKYLGPYTRRQINQDRMIFGDFSVNSEPIFLKFCKGHLLFKS